MIIFKEADAVSEYGTAGLTPQHGGDVVPEELGHCCTGYTLGDEHHLTTVTAHVNSSFVVTRNVFGDK